MLHITIVKFQKDCSSKRQTFEMWHAARKQEKKVREMMVDYQKRAERRREHYDKLKGDPHQLLRLHGNRCKLHLDPKKAGDLDSTMIPWQGDADNMISRYDVRIHLDYIPDTSKLQRVELSRDEKLEESRCNYERYRPLVQNLFNGLSEENALRQIDVEEMYPTGQKGGKESKEKSRAKAAIGFSYSEEAGGQTDEDILTAFLEEQNEEREKAFSSESEYEVDMDVDKFSSGEVDKLNVFALDYGIPAGAFSKSLRVEKSELEEQKLARITDKEKTSTSGRKARKERKNIKENQSFNRLPTPPSYARRGSPTYEPYENSDEQRSRSSSRSTSSESEGQVEFITEFGEHSNSDSESTNGIATSSVNKSTIVKPKRSRSRSIEDRKRRRSDSREREDSRRKVQRSPSPRSYRSRRSRSRSRKRSHRSRHYSNHSYSSSPSRERYHRRGSGYRSSRRSRSRSHNRGRYSRRRSHSRSRSPHKSRRSRSRSRSPRRSRRSHSRSRSPRRSRRSHSRSRSPRRRSRSHSHSRRSRSRSRSPYNHSRKRRERSHSSSRSRSRSPPHKSSRSKSSQSPSVDRKEFSSVEAKSKSAQVQLVSKSKSKLTPKEKLKKKMQAQLNKQFKTDKKIQKKKNLQKEAEKMEREDQLREQMRKVRDVRDRSEYTFASTGETYSDRKSRSPSPLSPVRHGVHGNKDPAEFYYGRFS